MATDAKSMGMELRSAPISQLQGDAWAAWNASYHAPEHEAYRIVSLALYRQDVHERITALFARSDEQNARLDALLAEREKRQQCSRRCTARTSSRTHDMPTGNVTFGPATWSEAPISRSLETR